MKLDKYLKEKFIYTSKSNIFKTFYFLIQKYFKNKPKYSYSFGGVDLLVNHFFRNQKKGVYLDIGCYHPINGSNTYLLYKKGWNGINIDSDFESIKLSNDISSSALHERICQSD